MWWNRFLKTPAADVIYRTISDNMKTIHEQKRSLQKLQRDAQSLRLYNTSPWRTTQPATASPLSSLCVQFTAVVLFLWPPYVIGGHYIFAL